MSELTTIELGPEADLSVRFEAGKLRVGVDYAGQDGEAGLYVSADATKLLIKILEEAKKIIPGPKDDFAFDLLISGVKTWSKESS